MRVYLIVLAVVALSLVEVGNALAGWFGPSSFDECILENMKGVGGDMAAREVHRACRKKFPNEEAANNRKKVPSSVLRKLDIQVVNSPFGEQSVIFYNGDSEWTICSLVIRVKNPSAGNYKDYEAKYPGMMSAFCYGEPLTKDDRMTFKIFDKEEGWTWELVGATGIRKKN